MGLLHVPYVPPRLPSGLFRARSLLLACRLLAMAYLYSSNPAAGSVYIQINTPKQQFLSFVKLCHHIYNYIIQICLPSDLTHSNLSICEIHRGPIQEEEWMETFPLPGRVRCTPQNCSIQKMKSPNVDYSHYISTVWRDLEDDDNPPRLGNMYPLPLKVCSPPFVISWTTALIK